MHARVTACLAACLAAMLGAAEPAFAATPCQPPPPAEQRAAAEAINRLRTASGLPALRADPVLSAAAAAQACAMAARGRMAHSGGGRGPGATLRQAGYRFSVVAENVAAGPWDMGQVLGAWQSSPRHVANMTIPQTREMGIAVATGPDGRTRYWAAIFAARR